MADRLRLAIGMEQPTDDNDSVAGELLLASIGLRRLLDGTKPLQPTADLRENATALPFRWRRAIRRFIRDEGPELEPSGQPATKAELIAVIEAVNRGQSVDELSGRLGGLDGDIAASLMAAAAVATMTAKIALPLRPGRVTALGAEEGQASDLEIARFRLIWGIVDNPTTALDDMARLRLTTKQVRALSTAYPGLYGLLQKLAAKELIDYKEAKPKATMSRVRDMQLRLLLGIPPWDPEKMKQLQGSFGGDGPGSPPKPTGGNGTGDKGLQTQTQQIAGG